MPLFEPTPWAAKRLPIPDWLPYAITFIACCVTVAFFAQRRPVNAIAVAFTIGLSPLTIGTLVLGLRSLLPFRVAFGAVEVMAFGYLWLLACTVVGGVLSVVWGATG